MQYSKKKLIQLIHIAKSQLYLDDATYRQVLKNLTKKNSAKELTIPELFVVYEHLKQRGFKTKTKKRNHSPTTEKARVKSNIALKIRAIWIAMYQEGIVKDGSEQALNAFARNIINPIFAKEGENIQVLNVTALNDKQATIVLERLKRWAMRAGITPSKL